MQLVGVSWSPNNKIVKANICNRSPGTGKVVYSNDSATAQSNIKDEPKGITLNGHIERPNTPYYPTTSFRFDPVLTFQLWIRPKLAMKFS